MLFMLVIAHTILYVVFRTLKTATTNISTMAQTLYRKGLSYEKTNTQ